MLVRSRNLDERKQVGLGRDLLHDENLLGDLNRNKARSGRRNSRQREP
jgi:hypothetical protein